MATSDGEDEQVLMSELATGTPFWADENSPKWAVNWSKVRLSDAPASQRTPADYRQDTASPSGFDEKYLPSELLLGNPEKSNPPLDPL